MNCMKRLFAVGLTLALLACLMVPAVAESYPEILLGNEVQVAVSEDNSYTTYRFIPETDGWYGFYSHGDDQGAGGRAYYMENGKQIDLPNYHEATSDPHFLLKYYLTANVAYYLEVYPYSEDGSCYIGCKKLTAATSLELDYDAFCGYVGTRIGCTAQLSPALSVPENVTWVSGDETIAAVVDASGIVELLATGCTTITAISENGLTSSYTVEVIVPPEGCRAFGSSGPTAMWHLSHEGVLTFTGTGFLYEYPAVDFEYVFAVTETIIEDGITGINADAFGWFVHLETVTIAESVRQINEWTFYGLDSLTDIRFLGSAPIIGECAFDGVTATAYYPAGDPSWTADVMQSYGGDITWVPYGADAEGISFSCNVESVGDDGTLMLELWQVGNDAASYTVTDGCSFTNVAAGDYTLVVSKPNHVTREYAVTVCAQDLTLDVKICLLGDVNGDGSVNIGDAAKVYSHIRGTSALTDEYQLACANVNDGELNIGDAASLYSHIRGTKKLY